MADDKFKTPQLIITDVGLAAAQTATPVGPFIHITKFQIGSAYGYTPTRAMTGITGELLFEGAPLSYKYVGDNTLDIICRLPAEAGPFEFGEVALFLESDQMFALAAFETPQIKYSSLGTNVLSTYTFNCLLKLDQAVAVFKIDTNCLPPDIWEVDKWSDVYPPALSANPGIPSILVREADTMGNATLIVQANDAHWSMAGNYHCVGRGTVVASTTSSVTLQASELPNVDNGTLLNEYVLTFADGYMRACSSVAVIGSGVRFVLTDPLPAAPAVGSKVLLNSMLTNQTRLTIQGGATGSAIIKGSHVEMDLAIDKAAALARSALFDVAGDYAFTVPDGVNFLYLDGAGAGAGGGGAGGGFPTQNWPYSYDPAQPPSATNTYWAYRAGGGAGGGGAGFATTVTVLAVTPGEVIQIKVGKGGAGGIGGAPGQPGTDGQAGTATVLVGSFGTFTLNGGVGGGHGADYGSGNTGAGGPGGTPGGVGGIDGLVGAAGGPGGTSAFGAGGSGGRGATGGPGNKGAGGSSGNGNASGGGGGGACYVATSTDAGGDGGPGRDGIVALTW